MGEITLYLVTGNMHKLKEVSQILGAYGIRVEKLDAPKLEVQSSSIQEVARLAAALAYQLYHKPVVVDDSGLFIEALNGFPGPYSSYVYKTLGINGILKLMDGVDYRRAYFEAAVAYANGDEIRVFTGRVYGFISPEPRGTGGFGFDPIFIPDGYNETLAELGDNVKNKISHRSRAFTKLARWIAGLGRG